MAILLTPFWFIAPKIVFVFPIFRIWACPIKAIPETPSAHKIEYLCFSYYHWVDTSAGGLLVPEAIISLVVGDLAMIWLNGCMYYWHLLFLSKVIMNQT
jgi:hypothetical protein